MKIAVFTPSFLPKASGAEIFHHNLASRLTSAGHQVTLIVPRKNLRKLRDIGVSFPYGLVPFPANLWSYFKRSVSLTFRLSDFFLSRLQARHRFDLWHGVMTWPTGVSLIHWQDGRQTVPYLIRCAGDDVLTNSENHVGARLNPIVDRLTRQYLPRAARLVSLSESISREYRALGVSPDRIDLIPNGVDLSRFRRQVDRLAVRRTLGLRPEAFLFLSVGRNSPQKGYPTLLAAAQELKREGLPSQWLIVGRDTERLKLAARELGDDLQTGEIGFTGNTLTFPPDALIDLYLAADAFVIPSVFEGFSTALLEAMAAGLPIIASDSPGCREMVRFGRDALLVPPGNAADLASAMRRVFLNEPLRRGYASLSAIRAADFEWKLVLAQYERVYREMIG
jgi:glycosyltransferase involved in cell wall biosynthesis